MFFANHTGLLGWGGFAGCTAYFAAPKKGLRGLPRPDGHPLHPGRTAAGTGLRYLRQMAVQGLSERPDFPRVKDRGSASAGFLS